MTGQILQRSIPTFTMAVISYDQGHAVAKLPKRFDDRDRRGICHSAVHWRRDVVNDQDVLRRGSVPFRAHSLFRGDKSSAEQLSLFLCEPRERFLQEQNCPFSFSLAE